MVYSVLPAIILILIKQQEGGLHSGVKTLMLIIMHMMQYVWYATKRNVVIPGSGKECIDYYLLFYACLS